MPLKWWIARGGPGRSFLEILPPPQSFGARVSPARLGTLPVSKVTSKREEVKRKLLPRQRQVDTQTSALRAHSWAFSWPQLTVGANPLGTFLPPSLAGGSVVRFPEARNFHSSSPEGGPRRLLSVQPANPLVFLSPLPLGRLPSRRPVASPRSFVSFPSCRKLISPDEKQS